MQGTSTQTGERSGFARPAVIAALSGADAGLFTALGPVRTWLATFAVLVTVAGALALYRRTSCS